MEYPYSSAAYCLTVPSRLMFIKALLEEPRKFDVSHSQALNSVA